MDEVKRTSTSDNAQVSEIADVFSSRRWRRYWLDETAPHALFVAQVDDGKVAVLVSRRTRANGDWSMGQSALDYIVKAEREGRLLRGYVVLAEKDTVLAAERAIEVAARIGNAQPNEAYRYGPYFWLDDQLRLLSTNYAGDEVPF